MTHPDDVTREQPAVEPTVSTAPPPARPHRWWSAIPTHLGRARTSTIVIGVLFLALFALYLNVRPDPVGTTTREDTPVTEPATTTGGTTPAPTSTPPAPTTTVAPTTPEEATTTAPTTESTLPSETTSSLPTTTESTPAPPVPTTATPTG